MTRDALPVAGGGRRLLHTLVACMRCCSARTATAMVLTASRRSSDLGMSAASSALEPSHFRPCRPCSYRVPPAVNRSGPMPSYPPSWTRISAAPVALVHRATHRRLWFAASPSVAPGGAHGMVNVLAGPSAGGTEGAVGSAAGASAGGEALRRLSLGLGIIPAEQRGGTRPQ